MFHREVNLSKTHSFFLFGARGTGKSTLLKSQYIDASALYIDLLEDRAERRYKNDPDLLLSDIEARKRISWVIIDEIQKVPKLLDLVHKTIVEKKIKFILTGSSARKLKRSGSNLLAGRAFLYHLFPFTHRELGKFFDLTEYLMWGGLPEIFSFQDTKDKTQFLNSYVKTYLREEILAEQIIRNVEGFRNFLEIAAQMNAKTINFSKIARDSGVDVKTVQSYYQILEDTLIGFTLPAYHKSVRKAQKNQPKFFLFDIGVTRALEGSLDSRPVPGTSAYGFYFESFVITEVYRANQYSQKDFHLSHYQSSTGQEIDLILSKGKQLIVIEIKSTTRVDRVEVSRFAKIAEAFKGSKKYFISQDSTPSLIDGVRCLNWQDFIAEVFD